ncbi:hypothetical protein AB0L00_09480 [Actinoallomurus sp. NPDC052308]|uniref:hypothetical protein n=1 Tax=Actinoallomurus sp. NPDC052308 TaxID=3155530 RepID=UPI0034247F20
MSSSPPAGPVTPASVDARAAQLTGRLADALTARGLRARVGQGARVLASNPAGEPPDDDHRAKVLSPGLRQTVVCGVGRDGRLMWFWQWSGPTRESPPEYEPLCAADDISHAADRIAYVLRLGGPSQEAER